MRYFNSANELFIVFLLSKQNGIFQHFSTAVLIFHKLLYSNTVANENFDNKSSNGIILYIYLYEILLPDFPILNHLPCSIEHHHSTDTFSCNGKKIISRIRKDMDIDFHFF